MQLLYRINRAGTTVVMATHDREMVDKMRRRVIQLEDGRVVRDDRRGGYEAMRWRFFFWEALASIRGERRDDAGGDGDGADRHVPAGDLRHARAWWVYDYANGVRNEVTVKLVPADVVRDRTEPSAARSPTR